MVEAYHIIINYKQDGKERLTKNTGVSFDQKVKNKKNKNNDNKNNNNKKNKNNNININNNENIFANFECYSCH